MDPDGILTLMASLPRRGTEALTKRDSMRVVGLEEKASTLDTLKSLTSVRSGLVSASAHQ